MRPVCRKKRASDRVADPALFLQDRKKKETDIPFCHRTCSEIITIRGMAMTERTVESANISEE